VADGTTELIVETQHLTKIYQNRQIALNDVTLSIEPGSVLGLLGPNGAGKTTTLKAVAGMFRRASGTVEVVRHGREPERSPRIALIPEVPIVYGLLTIWEHMELVARACKIDATWRGRAEHLLRGLELFERRDTLGHELSKGMKQKTLIAATLLSEADVFLFDEPTVGLDISAQSELARLIESVSASAAVVVSTHQVDLISTVSDRVIVMHGGRIVAGGDVPFPDRSASREFIETLYAEAMA